MSASSLTVCKDLRPALAAAARVQLQDCMRRHLDNDTTDGALVAAIRLAEEAGCEEDKIEGAREALRPSTAAALLSIMSKLAPQGNEGRFFEGMPVETWKGDTHSRLHGIIIAVNADACMLDICLDSGSVRTNVRFGDVRPNCDELRIALDKAAALEPGSSKVVRKARDLLRKLSTEQLRSCMERQRQQPLDTNSSDCWRALYFEGADVEYLEGPASYRGYRPCNISKVDAAAGTFDIIANPYMMKETTDTVTESRLRPNCSKLFRAIEKAIDLDAEWATIKEACAQLQLLASSTVTLAMRRLQDYGSVDDTGESSRTMHEPKDGKAYRTACEKTIAQAQCFLLPLDEVFFSTSADMGRAPSWCATVGTNASGTVEIQKQPCFQPLVFGDKGNEYVRGCSSTLYHCKELLPEFMRQSVLAELSALPSVLSNESAGTPMSRRLIDPDAYVLDAVVNGSELQWIPTEFVVQRHSDDDAGGRWLAQITSPLPEIDAEMFPGVYDKVSMVFAAMLPSLWRVLVQQQKEVRANRYLWSGVLRSDFEAKDPSKATKMRVVVKAVTQHVAPGSEYQGFWHSEGASEMVRAVGIYYCDACFPEPQAGVQQAAAELRFRSNVLTYGFSTPYARDGSDDVSVSTATNNAVTFSNLGVIHRVGNVVNASTTEQARRTFLAFFELDSDDGESLQKSPQDGTGQGKAIQIAVPPSTALTGYRDVAICARRLQKILRDPAGRTAALTCTICCHVCDFLGLGITAEESKRRSWRLREQRLKARGSGWHDPTTNSPEMHAELNGWSAMDRGVMSFHGGRWGGGA